jgi:hypothetical protein
MPDRIIRERVTTSPELDACTAEAERLFYRQLVRADDYGRFEATPTVMLAACFPRRAGAWKPARVARWRDELAGAGLWDLYEISSRLYGCFRTWGRHQRRRDSKPKFPPPDHPDAKVVPPRSAANGGESPQIAASRGDPPPVAARARDVRGRASESRESRDESREGRGEARRPAAGQEKPEVLSLSDQEGNGNHHGPEVKAMLADLNRRLSAPTRSDA